MSTQSDVGSFSGLGLSKQFECISEAMKMLREPIRKELTGFQPISSWLEDSFGKESLANAYQKIFRAPISSDTYCRHMASVHALVHVERNGVAVTAPVRQRHVLLSQHSVEWVLAEFHYARRFNDTELTNFWKSGKEIPLDKYKIDLIDCGHLTEDGLWQIVLHCGKRVVQDILTSLLNLHKHTVSARFERLQEDVRNQYKFEAYLKNIGFVA